MAKIRISLFPRWLCLCWIWFCGCSSSCEPERPGSLIPADKMSEVQADVHILEASVQSMPFNARDSIARLLYAHLFRIHGLEERQYYESLEYYGRHPAELHKVYVKTYEMLEGRGKGE